MALIANVLRGFAMGVADLVPGVSGGTVALLVGVYRRLVGNIAEASRALGELLRGQVRPALTRLRSLEWGLLVPLAVGIGLAVVSLAGVIEHLLETQPVGIAAVFFGLVVASAIVAGRLVAHWDARRVGIAVAVGVAAFLLLGLRGGAVSDPSLVLFALAGAVAVCAMILPGVSGSFLLLMLGMYDNVLGAVTDRDLVTLGVFVVGCVVGLAAFSRVLHWGLVHHESTLLAAMVGLLVGSLRVLWPWPEGTESTTLAAPSGNVVGPVLLAVAAAGLVLALTAVAERSQRRSDADLAGDLSAD
jgi:putative membrane protein